MKNILKKFTPGKSKVMPIGRQGFTLIELLVVIAIIGLLAGIVLVSLGGARDGARDARIVASLQQTRSIAELVFNDASPLQYDSLCDAGDTLNTAHANYGTELTNIETDIDGQNGGGAVPACWAASDDFCVSAVLATGGTACISSTGQSGDDTCIAPTTACAP
jgi:prepilin-type N-terminal cleavage/methylation domain-containing protein